MRICIVSPNYPTKDGKGGYFFVEQLVLNIISLGHECTVIAPVNIASKYFVHRPYGRYHEEYCLENGGSVNIYRPRFYGRNLALCGICLSSYLCQKAIERVIKRHRLHFDVMYGHFFRSAALVWYYASRHCIPLFVATGESVIPEMRKTCRSFSLEKFRYYLSGVICVSTKNKKEAIKMGYTTEEKCVVIPNGVDLSLFKPLDRERCRNRLSIRKDNFVIICVGNFTDRKGQRRIVEAVDRLNIPNIKVILAGRGDLCMDSPSILYKGFVSHDQLPLYLNASDAYVLPTRWEGCCNSIIEAMACGLPIISSDRSFNWDILNKDNSILIDPDSEEQITNAIYSLFKDNELRRKLSNKALDSSKTLSIEERAKKIIAFIENRINQ